MHHIQQGDDAPELARKFSTLVEALLAAPPERPFITMWRDEDDIQEVTFGEFIDFAKSQAVSLHEKGVEPGDTIILIMPQGIPLMAAFAGAMLLGAVPAILPYPNSKADPAKYSAGLSGVSQNLKARLLVVDEAFPSPLLTHLALADGAQLVYSGSLTLPCADFQPPDYRHSPDRLAFIQHSAGTTGLQKGVALTHAAVLTQLEHLAAALKIDSRDRIYSWLPLYHDMGLIACYMLPLVSHVPIVMQSPMDWVMQPATMLELISNYRCSLAWIPNFALQFLARRVREEDRRSLDLSPLRALINCSEPVRNHSMDEFISAYAPYGLQPNVLQSSYAMAENVFAVTQSEIRSTPRRIWVDGNKLLEKNQAVRVAKNEGTCFVSSGRCLPNNKVRIVSSDGRDLPDYEVGEIVIQSDSLFDGYHNRPDLSAAVVKDGWYWTGDLGFFGDGELYVIGRKKDLIIVAGKNFYPQDIEEIVSRHPAIHDGRVVATGLYNEDQGTEEIIIAAELDSPKDENESFEIERAIRNAIVEELGVAPRAIFLKPPAWIVKSTAGKPARSTTREKLLAEHPALNAS